MSTAPNAAHTWSPALTGGPCPTCGDVTLAADHVWDGLQCRQITHVDGRVCSIAYVGLIFTPRGGGWQWFAADGGELPLIDRLTAELDETHKQLRAAARTEPIDGNGTKA